MLDTAQLLGSGAITLGENAHGRLAMVQLADLSWANDHPDWRLPPGLGCLPIRDLMRHLADAGYTGWWEVEVAQASPGVAWLRFLYDTVSELVDG